MVAFEALSFYELSVNVNGDDHRRSVLIVFFLSIAHSLTIFRNILGVVELLEPAGWRGIQLHLPAQV